MTSQAHPSTKRKSSENVDRQHKKPKVVAEPTAATTKLPPKLGPRKGKGLMTGANLVTEKRLVLLCEDSGYMLK